MINNSRDEVMILEEVYSGGLRIVENESYEIYGI